MILRKVHLAPLGAALLAVLVFSTPSQAKIYKWIDEQGVTHYTQQPPLKIKAQKMTPARPPAQDPARAGQRLDRRGEGQSKGLGGSDQEGSRDAQASAHNQQREQFCDQTRENLTLLAGKTRLMEKNEDGSTSLLTPEQRIQKTEQLQAQLAEHCGV